MCSFGLVWFYGTSTIVGYLMPNSFLYIKTVLFQIIQLSISTQFSCSWLIDRTLSGATIPGQTEPGSNGNEWVLCISQRSSITGASLSDCLVSYPGHSLVGGFISLCREAFSVFYSPNQLGKSMCSKMFDKNKVVALTDLFPLANQPHTDQSGAEHIDSFFFSRTFSSSPFLKSADSERAPS